MIILHYALGFPPYRSGGMTKFCVDLMIQQAKEGHSVALIWPGQIGFINKEVSIKKHNNVSLNNQSVYSFEIINPLPISYDEGISNISMFTANLGKGAYDQLLDFFHPDIIHLHTLMGLHKSFLQSAKERKIRLVFTAHDFFPICPKVTVYRHEAICSCVKSQSECGMCNATALSIRKIKLLQSPLYRDLKDSIIIKKLRKQHRDTYLSGKAEDDKIKSVGTAADYKSLRNYYYSLLKMVDIIHYNSNVTKNVYESVFNFPNNRIISITHAHIRDNRKIKNFSKDKLHIRYLGPQSGAKGYFLLREALDDLWSKRQNFCLDIHFVPTEKVPYIQIHDRYSYKDLKKIFDETDVLIAPSILYETFGFTVLEALSYGVPVIISGTVGAKDILTEGSSIVIDSISAKKLSVVLQNLTAEKLRYMNKKIVENQTILQIENMSKIIEKTCYGWQ